MPISKKKLEGELLEINKIKVVVGDDIDCFFLSARDSNKMYKTGKTNRVRKVAMSNPPITTVANGL